MNVTYDAQSFMLDGRRIWITAGEIHYFRHPRAEWRQALLRAKRAGLNAVATYVPWNFHETVEGEVSFEGDKDLAAYLDLIGELGMYAMVRPGPYICSEWDGGGLPAWLCAKDVLRFREDDPVYMEALERWFDRLLPMIAERQITRGGPVLTVQNENEYPGGWDESMRRYIRKISVMLRRHGIDVPVLACNVHGDSETKVRINDSTDPADQVLGPELILTYNHHVVVEPVYDLKSKQPDAPLIVTEFWSGAPVHWGQQVSDWPDRLELARAAYEYLSAGTQICYYMFDGGTNFGFFGGNNIATAYTSGYPVGEGGKLMDKYYVTRPVNLFAGQFADWLADSVECGDKGGIVVPEGVRLVVRRSGNGAAAFLSAHDRRKEVPVELPGGRRLTVPLGDASAAVLPVGLQVFGGGAAILDYANLTLLAKDEARQTLILYGPAGTEGVVSVGGQELRIPIARRKPEVRQAAGITLVIADEEMARRCWPLEDGTVVFGPDYVGERKEDGAWELMVTEGSPDAVYLDADGRLAGIETRFVKDGAGTPALGGWQAASCAGLMAETAPGWLPLQGPRSHEELGVTQGYVWYAAEWEGEADGVETLLVTHSPNRVSVFANGRYCGTAGARRSVRMSDDYAHPADWAFEEVAVPVAKGRNRFVFLSDDLGHNYDVPIPVGLRGPVYVGSRIEQPDGFRDVPPQPVSEDALRFLYSRFYRKPDPLPAVEFELGIAADRQAFLAIHGVHAWVTIDGEDVPPLSYPESPWTMFAQIKRRLVWQLPDRASGRTCTVRIQFSETVAEAVKENLTVYTVPRAGALTNWQWRRWEETGDFADAAAVESREAEKQGAVVLLPVGSRVQRKGRTLVPAYFETSFPRPAGDRPVYLDVGQMFKGQIFLNGHNVGRFWRFGDTQQRYYLPRAWMADDNRLTVFEELGLDPQGVDLVFGEAGQWTANSWQPDDAKAPIPEGGSSR